MLVVPALVLAAACSEKATPMDEALKNDLSLASSMQPQQQFVSPVEMGYGGYGYAQPASSLTGITRTRHSPSRSAGSTARRPARRAGRTRPERLGPVRVS
jgi:hypothetical protein